MNTTIKPEHKGHAVAEYIAGIAQENDAQYHTSDEDEAMLISMVMTEFVTNFTVPHIRATAPALQHSYKTSAPSVEVWTYFVLNTNWLSWAWHKEEEPELSRAWAKVWYEMNDFSLKTLKGKDLQYYIEKTD